MTTACIHPAFSLKYLPHSARAILSLAYFQAIVLPGGHWFGNLDPRASERLLGALEELRDVKGVPPDLADIWRGQMGMTKAEQIQAFEACSQCKTT